MRWLTVQLNYDAKAGTITKNFVGSPAPDKTAAEITRGDAVAVELGSGWDNNDYIASVEVGHIENGSTGPLEAWTPPNPGRLAFHGTDCFDLTPNPPEAAGPDPLPNSRPTAVTMQNIEVIAAGSEDYSYQISVQTAQGAIDCDPEVINKAGEDEPQWAQLVPAHVP